MPRRMCTLSCLRNACEMTLSLHGGDVQLCKSILSVLLIRLAAQLMITAAISLLSCLVDIATA